MVTATLPRATATGTAPVIASGDRTTVPVVVDGREVGRLAVRDLLP